MYCDARWLVSLEVSPEPLNPSLQSEKTDPAFNLVQLFQAMKSLGISLPSVKAYRVGSLAIELEDLGMEATMVGLSHCVTPWREKLSKTDRPRLR